ncbi:MAG TPA: tryptophan-rich sensory protein [Chryseolinea sp.]|mgnify:CR=1 FL=1|nr:tryptophan-rich sensory protein [Chryseolinea sp.]HPM31804.1 tryptophan-rich sensory protein [Chryseolinea sp.]
MLRIVSSISLALTLLVNALANILPINGHNTGEVSALYPSLFTPAGITFSIWSILYVLLIGFVVFSWTTKDDRINKLLPAFILSNIFNALWILVWHYRHPELSVLVMVSLLATLTYIFIQIQSSSFLSKKEYVCVVLPFTLYLAWICVATIANISAWLVSISWGGWGIMPEMWTIIMMIIAALLAFYISSKFSAPAFVLVVIWALVGIYLRWNESDFLIILKVAIVLILFLSAIFVYRLGRIYKSK